jgi:CBS domain-containing protein
MTKGVKIMQVQDIMTHHVTHCTPEDSLRLVAEMMVKCDCGAIPVVDRETQKVYGIVTDRDIVCRAVAVGQNPIDMVADEVMTMPITAVEPDTTLGDCLARMETAQVRRMLVVDKEGHLRGVVSQADIARVAPEHAATEFLKDVSKPTGHASAVV